MCLKGRLSEQRGDDIAIGGIPPTCVEHKPLAQADWPCEPFSPRTKF